MVRLKKNTFVLFACLCVCLLLGACTASPDDTIQPTAAQTTQGKPVLVGNIPCAFPLVAQPVTLSILSARSSADESYDELFVWKRYEQMTGVTVDWTTVARSDRSKAVRDALSSPTPPDLIIRCRTSQTSLTLYGHNGLILDLAKDDLLKNNAPNCWAYLQSHPDTLGSIMNPDGSIYSLPQVNSGAELRVSRKLYINKHWLQNVGMALPKTTEELYELLLAFKRDDANGNGDPDDEIPLCAIDWASMQEAFYGAFGLGTAGVHNMTVDADPATGKTRLIAATDGYRAFLQYFNRLYTQGLFDGYLFTSASSADAKTQWLYNIASDRVGVFAHTNLAELPVDRVDDWVAVEEALEGPNGDKLWAAVRANFHSTGAAFIPSACSDPALALRWLDYFWTDEGTLFYHMGVEGETFMPTADGGYDYLPLIYEEAARLNQSFDQTITKYTPYPGGGNPTVEIAPYFMGGEMAPIPAQAARKLFPYGPKEYWPSFTYTVEENEELRTIETDMNKYCTSATTDFIVGDRSFDDWEKYLSQLDALGAERMLAICQAAVDRYHALLHAKE